MQWDKDGTSLCWVLPASSVKMKAKAGRRHWKPVLGGYRNQLHAPLLKEREAKGAWESQMSADGYQFAWILASLLGREDDVLRSHRMWPLVAAKCSPRHCSGEAEPLKQHLY